MRKHIYASLIGSDGSWFWFNTYSTKKELDEDMQRYKYIYDCYAYEYSSENHRLFILREPLAVRKFLLYSTHPK